MPRRRFCYAIAHYTSRELTPERKALATIDSHNSYLKLHIKPKWGECRMSDVRTIAVEEWLGKLPLAPGSRAKIRNIMSALFSRAIRYEWITFNPITKVRTSAAQLREPDVLTPDEFRALLPKLALRERTMVMLAGSTGLRRSEMFAFTLVGPLPLDHAGVGHTRRSTQPLRRCEDARKQEACAAA